MSAEKPIKKSDAEDYESISVSLKSHVAYKIEEIADKTNHTHNEIINLILEQEVNRPETT